MKYKVLLTGTNQVLINDFFNHMDFSFECMYSSARPADILCHLKYYRPAALIFCLYKEGKKDVSGFFKVMTQLNAEKIPMIIVGTEENCGSFEKLLPMAADLTIIKPNTIKALEERLVAYFEQLTEEAEREAKQQEEERKAAEAELEKERLAALEQVPADANAADSASPKKKHILIVDDDSSVLKLVKGYLGAQYNVATAINGKVALRFLEKKETDLILLDYEMPEENGAQVLRKIRNNEKTKDLPVVFLTGMTERERIQEVLELKPQGYLLKPIDTDRLSATLKGILKV